MNGTMFNTLLAAANVTVETPIDGQTGVWIKQGATVISSGMKMVGATVNVYQVQYVYGSGVASRCTIYNGGSMRLSGGAAMLCSVTGQSGIGRIIVFGGIATSTHIDRLGRMTVNQAGAVASDTVVNYGLLDVSSGGVAVGTVVNSGGSLFVSTGGTALAVASNAGAVVSVYAGGYIEYA